jgi:hypothetical protein
MYSYFKTVYWVGFCVVGMRYIKWDVLSMILASFLAPATMRINSIAHFGGFLGMDPW